MSLSDATVPEAVTVIDPDDAPPAPAPSATEDASPPAAATADALLHAAAAAAAAEELALEAAQAVPEPDEPAAPERVTFAHLGLSEPILRAVQEAGYVHPTPIQEQAIPVVLMGRDVLGVAQTGTGKTAGFTLPMLDILASGRAKARMPRSLILEPTRELALQVAENFVKYGKYLNLTHALLIGGESMDEQKAVLEKGVDVLIATPGRLLDLFERGKILLADCKLLVIDEADRMLDMGFIPDVERIVSMLPKIRQTLFFSATIAPEIRRLADAFLSNPKQIAVSRSATVATTIVAGLAMVRVHDKRETLRRLLRREDVLHALIFCNRKRDVDVLHKSLQRHGFSVGALHGDMEQSVRFATLNRFKAGEVKLLVCSDVAARGLDIGGLSHVFNFDVPYHAEDYVHRIGRTGRAGREGHAYTIATPDEAKSVAAIERLTGRPIPRIDVDGLDPVTPEEMAEAEAARPSRGRGGRAAAPGAARRGAGEARTASRGRGGERREAPPARAAAEPAVATVRRSRRPAAAASAVEPHEAEPRQPEPRREREVRPAVAVAVEVPAAPRREREARPVAAAVEPSAAPRRGGRDERDLGPAVLGFGDAVPAFMLIPVPRPPRRDGVARTAAAAAAEAAEMDEPEAEAA